jgi:putative SOS response-associated peptidase YedK
MCNEAARRIALGQLREDWSELRVPLVFPEGLPNLAPAESIRITDPALILRAAPSGDESAVEGVTRRWSWPGPSGRPVYNYRTEGRGLANAADGRSGRCLLVVDSFFEFTDPPADAPPKSRKTKWRFRDARADWFCIAGWWRTEPRLGEGRLGEAFAMLTCDPGPDVAPYHSRQVVLPPRDAWIGWLAGTLPAAEVCRPAPAGTLTAERA